ncbi:hypothetical protein HYH03_001125 [Edaphochlamys debaryana]|uniref:Transmembrane protein 19 n=1 Tax=Edaphochlamys debaryana TaxID=47281 RepID=A0A835YP90_9CHLO|nr:hypothetical protein HYH03_001125 [Edaphochlamys debaryana]|eukprot:KAG2501334.1 hypothetical protein HYH03_001125 [Edaphochlamys debaryana]
MGGPANGFQSLPPGLGSLAAGGPPPASNSTSAAAAASVAARSAALEAATASAEASTTAAPPSYSEHYRRANTPFYHSPDASSGNGSPSSSASTSSSSSGPSLSHVSNGSGPSSPAPSPGSDAAEVSAALARAQAALERAETSLDDIQRLSSSIDAAALASLARATAPPTRWQKLLSLARSLIILGSLAVAMLATHAFGLGVQWAGAAAGAALIAGWGLRSGSLAPSGAAAAFVVGCGTLGASLRMGATLVAFFLSSSKLTAYKHEMKEGLEENAKKGGQRTWVQVLCNGLVPTILAVAYGILAGCVDLPLGPPAASATAAAALEPWRAAWLTALMGGFLGYYACCCGDTWASELGPLSADTPRLITTLRPVRRGTNGGVTLLGLSASIMGGMFVGLVFYLAGLASPTLWIFKSQRALAVEQWRLIPLGLVAGLVGSALDSLLGATVQFTGFDPKTQRIVGRPGPGVVHIAGKPWLDNNAVNALSASLTAVLTAYVALKSFGF